MDRNSLLQSTFEIVIWPEIQDYMTYDVIDRDTGLGS